MRRVIFDEDAERELVAQIDYLIQHGAVSAAHTLEAYVRSFIVEHLAVHPTIGSTLKHRNLWEFRIPRSRLVLWYRFTEVELQIVYIWHTSEDRQATE